jgi:hypothetical protein
LGAQHTKLIDLLVRRLSMSTFAKMGAYEKLIVIQVVDKFYAFFYRLPILYYRFRSPIYLVGFNEIWHRRPEPNTLFCMFLVRVVKC